MNRFIFIFLLLLFYNCKTVNSKSDVDSDSKIYTENKTTDYYSELSDRETKLLDESYKVQCVKNTNYKKVPALIGLHPISSFYMDLFASKELARIRANVYKKNDIYSIYYFKYGMLTGITRYNQQLDWHELSHDSIIAKAKLTPNGSLKLWWYGFYDTEQKKWVHKKSDFNLLGGDNPVLLKKCLDD